VSSPLILAIESATARVGCAVGAADEVLASAQSTRPRRHAESLVPQIRFVLEQAGVTTRDIELVAVDVGPGLYTGLRVGVTTAKAMAHTLAVPVIAVTSLDAIAHEAGGDADITVAIDARRGEVFHADYRVGDLGSSTGSEPAVSSPEVLAGVLAGRPGVRIVGDGAIAHEAVFTSSGLSVGGPSYPSAEAVLALAVSRIDAAVSPAEIEPRYLRRPDAVAKWGSGS
jgi:tRNA threonylcarbamoyladenosine biosynthesis protein TsaB